MREPRRGRGERAERAGEGAELQAPMAIVTMGGILVATFLTLLVIPAVYVGLEESLSRR